MRKNFSDHSARCGLARAAVLARAASRDRCVPARQLTEDKIRALITGLGDLRHVIRDTEPSVKAAIYDPEGCGRSVSRSSISRRGASSPRWAAALAAMLRSGSMRTQAM